MTEQEKGRLAEISNGLYWNTRQLKELKQNGGSEPEWQRHRKDPQCRANLS